MHIKHRHKRKGSALIESTAALVILITISLVLLKSGLDIIVPRQWTMKQTLADAYLTKEVAEAKTISFDDINANIQWPTYPNSKKDTVVVGLLPGGVEVKANRVRTKVPSTNNLVIDGGTATEIENPIRIKIWALESHLSYDVGRQNYTKSRTIIRAN